MVSLSGRGRLKTLGELFIAGLMTSRRLGLRPQDGSPADTWVPVPDHADDRYSISGGQAGVLALRDAEEIDGDTRAEIGVHDHQLAGDPLHAPAAPDRPLLSGRWPPP